MLAVSLVTLGVADIERATAFYEALGLKRSSVSQPSVSFLQAGAVVLSLFGRADVAEEAGVRDDGSSFSGIVLAYNLASEAEVDAVLEAVWAAGGKVLKPGAKTFWGGYSGHFVDLDGHVWEVAHNPGFLLDAEGRITLPA